MRIYVASSWRNRDQPMVVATLRDHGHEVYDFRNPGPDNYGFQWTSVSMAPKPWTGEELTDALKHPLSMAGFTLDMDALRWCEACVLVLPSGRSAHLEAGWAAGANKAVVVYMPNVEEPELMYLMTLGVVTTIDDVLAKLATQEVEACLRLASPLLLIAAREERDVLRVENDALRARVVELENERCLGCSHAASARAGKTVTADWPRHTCDADALRARLDAAERVIEGAQTVLREIASSIEEDCAGVDLEEIHSLVTGLLKEPRDG